MVKEELHGVNFHKLFMMCRGVTRISLNKGRFIFFRSFSVSRKNFLCNAPRGGKARGTETLI